MPDRVPLRSTPLTDAHATVIAGPNARERLLEQPGIYVGRYPIPALLRVFGHTATAEVTESGIAVTELVGLWRHLFQEIEVHRPVPVYGDFSDYRWIRVADLDVLDAYRIAVRSSKDAYQDRLYTASSNRFVSTVLKRSGVVLRRDAVRALGSSPGLMWRYWF